MLLTLACRLHAPPSALRSSLAVVARGCLLIILYVSVRELCVCLHLVAGFLCRRSLRPVCLFSFPGRPRAPPHAVDGGTKKTDVLTGGSLERNETKRVETAPPATDTTAFAGLCGFSYRAPRNFPAMSALPRARPGVN